MERLDFIELSGYNATECAIHLNRYLTAKPYVAGKRVLDVACGEGYGSKLLKDWGATSVVGVDVSSDALRVANTEFSEEGISFLNHSAEQLPFESNSFDVIVSFETIEHLEHPEAFLSEIARVVKFNGTVILSCPNDNYYAQNDENFFNPFHKRRYSWFDFKQLTEKYLGNGEAWFFGFGLRGFSTIPMDTTSFPETGQLPEHMTELLHYYVPHSAAMLPAERYLNHWNACYYLGVWGGNTDIAYTGSTFFPEEMFAPANDSACEELVRWKKSYVQEKQQEEIRYATLNEEYKALSSDFTQQQARLAELELTLKKKESELHIEHIAQERTSNLLKVAEIEKQFLWQRINKCNEALAQQEQLMNSRIMKVLFWLWKLKAKLFKRG